MKNIIDLRDKEDAKKLCQGLILDKRVTYEMMSEENILLISVTFHRIANLKKMTKLNKYSDKYRKLLKDNACGIFSIFCDDCDGTGTIKFRDGDIEACYVCKGKGSNDFGGLVCANCLLDGCIYCGYLGYFYTHDLETSSVN